MDATVTALFVLISWALPNGQCLEVRTESSTNVSSNLWSPLGVPELQETLGASKSAPFRNLKGVEWTHECTGMHRSCKQPTPTGKLGNFTCSCNKSCSRLGDCCLDIRDPEDTGTLDCTQLDQTSYPEIAVAVITRCGSYFVVQDSQIRELCENVTADSPLDRKLPVSSGFSQETYRNIYCAVCNGVPIEDWRIWTLTSNCLVTRESTLDKALSTCKFKAFPSSDVKSPTLCDSQVIRRCPSNWTVQSIRRKCEVYYAPVTTKYNNGRNFKNKFCALCHGLSSGEFTCTEGPKKPSLHARTPLLSSTLSLLLDVDDGEGGEGMVGSYSPCPEGHRAFTWKGHFTRNSGDGLTSFVRCVPTHWLSPEGETLNCSHTEVHIRAEVPFIVHRNGSLTFPGFTDVYSYGYYKILSNSSVLVCVTGNVLTIEKFSYAQRILTAVCLSVSLICIAVKLFLLVRHRPLSVAKCLLASLCVSLFFSHLLYLVSNEGWSRAACATLAVLNHYAQLMSLTWSLMLARDVHRTFSNSFQRYSSGRDQLRKYVLAAVFLPAIPVSLACVVEFASDWEMLRPRYGPRLCWLNNRNALLVFFALPLALLFLANCYLFVCTACKIVATAKSTEAAREAEESPGPRKKHVIRFFIYIKLAFLMGLTWAFGLVAAYGRSDALWYLFIIGHGLQGAFLLVGFTPCRFRQVLEVQYKRKAPSLHSLTPM